MMRKFIPGAIVLVLVMSVSVNAQVPRVEIWKDPFPPLPPPNGLGVLNLHCPGVGTLQTLKVGVTGLNAYFNAIEFSIEFPSAVTFVGDITSAPIVIGNSVDGIALSWDVPQNGFENIIVHEFIVQWNCDQCDQAYYSQFIRVRPHPITGGQFVRAVRWPDFVLIEAYGDVAGICLIVPVEETSWGKVKALYDE